jgi:hypothetical protein
MYKPISEGAPKGQDFTSFTNEPISQVVPEGQDFTSFKDEPISVGVFSLGSDDDFFPGLR